MLDLLLSNWLLLSLVFFRGGIKHNAKIAIVLTAHGQFTLSGLTNFIIDLVGFTLLLFCRGNIKGWPDSGRIRFLFVDAVSPNDGCIGQCSGGVEPIALDVVDSENNVSMEFLVHRQFTCLSERSRAPLKVTLERLLLCVDVGVLLQVLRQCEGLEAEDADVLLDR